MSDPNGEPIEPVDTNKTEPKVKWSTVLAAVVTFILGGVGSLVDSGALVEGIPDWLTVILSTILVGGGTFGAGRKAPHQYRAGEGGPKAFGRPIQ